MAVTVMLFAAVVTASWMALRMVVSSSPIFVDRGFSGSVYATAAAFNANNHCFTLAAEPGRSLPLLINLWKRLLRIAFSDEDQDGTLATVVRASAKAQASVSQSLRGLPSSPTSRALVASRIDSRLKRISFVDVVEVIDVGKSSTRLPL